MIARLAKRVGIIVVVDGDLGRFASVPEDQIGLPRYAATRRFSRVHDSLFGTFFGDQAGTYLDIGANIGLTVVPIGRKPLVRCIAFEADPANFATLRDNVRRNIMTNNVEMHEIAVIDRRATLQFGLDNSGNVGDHRIVTAGSQRKVIDVQAAPLDDLVHEIIEPLAPKIDVQGAEPFVIAGGRNTLDKVGTLALEFSPYHMAERMQMLRLYLTTWPSSRVSQSCRATATTNHSFARRRKHWRLCVALLPTRLTRRRAFWTYMRFVPLPGNPVGSAAELACPPRACRCTRPENIMRLKVGPA